MWADRFRDKRIVT